jgi:hypothetical protein
MSESGERRQEAHVYAFEISLAHTHTHTLSPLTLTLTHTPVLCEETREIPTYTFPLMVELRMGARDFFLFLHPFTGGIRRASCSAAPLCLVWLEIMFQSMYNTMSATTTY